MSIAVKPMLTGKNFAAEIVGADLGAGLDDSDFAQILAALDHYAVLVLRGQFVEGRTIGEDEQLRFARQFGPLDSSYIPASALRSPTTAARSASFGEVSNLDEHGQVWSENDRRRWFLMANYLWHSDTSYKIVPTWVTLLSAHEVPPVDGHTQFADMRAAWDALPPDMRERLQTLKAEHSVFHSRGMTGFTDFSEADRAAAPPVSQPLVRVNPRTGRISLYLSAHASHIIGWPLKEGRQLLQDLTERATTADNVYEHEWKVGDVVIWDNSATLHRAMPYDEFKFRRVLKRTSVNELTPVQGFAAA